MTKKLFFFIIGVLVLVTASCSSEDIEPQVPTPKTDVQSRASTTANPTLLTNWESCSTIQILGKQGMKISVATPWSPVTNSGLEETFAKDIKKADGWIMLFHTFADLTTDPDLNYMCFYNKCTGMMKFFYYSHTEDKGTRTVWNVESTKDKVCQPLFSHYDYFSSPINGSNQYSTHSVMLENATVGASYLPNGWNGFEMHVSEYHPQISSNNITIGAYNTVYSDFNFYGTTSSQITGQITTVNGLSNVLMDNPTTQALLSAAGDEAKNFGNKVASKLPKKSFVGIDLGNIVSKVVSGNIAAAVTDGLGFIFKAFSKPKVTVSEVSLSSVGSVKIAGNGETHLLSSVKEFTFDLNAILSKNGVSSNKIASLAKEQGSEIHLGVWNLKKMPTISYCRYSKIENYEPLPNEDPHNFDINGIVHLPEMTESDIQIEFNPDIKPYVVSYSVKTAMLDVVGGNRTLSVNKPNPFNYNNSNLIYNQDGIRTYGISFNATQPIRGLVYDIPYDVDINENTQFYYDWGTNASGYRAVAVIVTWTMNYGNKQQEFTESRVYNVEYKYNYTPLNESVVNTPPQTYLITSSNYNPYLRVNPIPDEKYTIGIPALTDGNGVGLSQQGR
ncbi:MAG: hypothetical protein HDS78_00745 [Bacteroidales bacterium]|nr:hypothetical protein [Bacteroidales bacterium]